VAGLVQATDGNFYGTTFYGGTGLGGSRTFQGGCGTIFKWNPTTGALSTPYNFCLKTNCTDGEYPLAGLIQATNGNFHGTTEYGGVDTACLGDCGTIFSLSVGLGPFVEALTYSGKVGSKIEFLGQGFTSSTTVSFNGRFAPRKIISGNYLTAWVPGASTTGFVTVTTSGGTLKSNRIFRVIPQIWSFSPTSGPAGTSVTITGASLAGATGVTFDGVQAEVTADSYIRMTATVPNGAKTGKIEVTTPGGTATSAGTFTVK